jgi:hypothetical protein
MKLTFSIISILVAIQLFIGAYLERNATNEINSGTVTGIEEVLKSPGQGRVLRTFDISVTDTAPNPTTITINVSANRGKDFKEGDYVNVISRYGLEQIHQIQTKAEKIKLQPKKSMLWAQLAGTAFLILGGSLLNSGYKEARKQIEFQKKTAALHKKYLEEVAKDPEKYSDYNTKMELYAQLQIDSWNKDNPDNQTKFETT